MKLRRRWRRRRRIVEEVGEQRFAFDLVIRGILIFQRLRTSRWMDLRMVEDLGFHFCAGDRYMLIFVCGCRFITS